MKDGTEIQTHSRLYMLWLTWRKGYRVKQQRVRPVVGRFGWVGYQRLWVLEKR